MEVNVGVTRNEVNSRFSCAALSDALRQVTMQPDALTISEAAGATLCCNIATVRRVSTNPGLFVVDSHTIYAWWHALCVVTRVDAASAGSKRWSPRQSSFFKEGRLCSGQPQATRTCVLASKSRCTSRPAKNAERAGLPSGGPALPAPVHPYYRTRVYSAFSAFFH